MDQVPDRADVRDSWGVQVGSGNFQVNVYGDSRSLPLAHSAYLEQVRQIAPPDPPGLLDRDAELAELSRFCLEPDGAPYAWWRAGPWAGKSALLSAFVLRPPAEVRERVRIVSYFITARLAAQETRSAFTQVLTEQLAELLRQPVLPAVPDAVQEAYLLSLMSQAAAACKEAGGRLVLVVDGLDEDRGVTTGQEAHSIAGLLPADPQSAMRVIVASRPNPPVPDDVPAWHPLRDPSVVRQLSASPHARDIQRLSKEELRRRLQGSPGERDVIGLLAVARGGLSAGDLADLSGLPLWEVEGVVSTVNGRIFGSRPNPQAPGEQPDVYLLGHEELQAAAVSYLGSARLGEYRRRLYDWAAGYRNESWPPGTPEYLLSGYFRLLDELGDLPRMGELALDRVRQDRMLDRTGGDAAILAEIRMVLERIAAQKNPDLASALALACRSQLIIDGNAHVPERLPAVWASLGHLPRAEALAASMSPEPGRQARILGGMAEALAQSGQHQHVSSLAQQAEQNAAKITTGFSKVEKVEAVTRIAGTLAATGHLEQATALVLQAETIARADASEYARATSLADISVALTRIGRHEQAVALAREASALARGITDDQSQISALVHVERSLAEAGQREQAAAIIQEAETAVRALTDRYGKDDIAQDVAERLARDGLPQRAEAMAHLLSRPNERARVLAHVAGTLADADQREQVDTLIRQAEEIAQATDPSLERDRIVSGIAGALAKAGRYEDAEAAARSVADLPYQSEALTDVAATLAGAGLYEQAIALAQQAEVAARSADDSDQQDRTMVEIAGVLARAGYYQQAALTARSISKTYLRDEAEVEIVRAMVSAGELQQAETTVKNVSYLEPKATALANVAAGLAAAGQHKHAGELAWLAVSHSRFTCDPCDQADLRAQAGVFENVAQVLARAGKYEQAESLARSIIFPEWQAMVLAEIAPMLARDGRQQHAKDIALSIAIPEHQAQALAHVAETLAQAGQHEHADAIFRQAEASAHALTSDYIKAPALATIAGSLAAAGQHEPAVSLAAEAERIACGIANTQAQAETLTRVTAALTKAGQYELAESAAQAIADPPAQIAALADLAATLAWAGHRDQAAALAYRAEATADTITQPGPRAQALARIAEILARAGDERRGSRVAAAVCAAGAWQAAMMPVFLLAPAAVERLLANWPRTKTGLAWRRHRPP